MPGFKVTRHAIIHAMNGETAMELFDEGPDHINADFITKVRPYIPTPDGVVPIFFVAAWVEIDSRFPETLEFAYYTANGHFTYQEVEDYVKARCGLDPSYSIALVQIRAFANLDSDHVYKVLTRRIA